MVDLEVCKQVFPDISWKHVNSEWVGVTGAHGALPPSPMYADDRSWLKNSFFEILKKDGLHRVYFYFNLVSTRVSIQSDDEHDLKACLNQVKAKLQKIALDFSELSGLTSGTSYRYRSSTGAVSTVRSSTNSNARSSVSAKKVGASRLPLRRR